MSDVPTRLMPAMAAHHHRIALRAGTESWTYADLHRHATRLASALHSSAGDPPERAGILAGDSAVAHVATLASLYAGAAAVPLSLSAPVARIAETIRAAGLTVVLTDERGRRSLDHAAENLPELRLVDAGIDTTAPVPAGGPLPAAADDTAYIMFTSGSTGRPKGVPVTHRNVLHFLDVAQERYGLTADDVLVQTFEPTFDLFMFGPLMAWSVGAELVVLPPRALRLLPEFVSRHRVTLWFSVPSTIRLARRLDVLRAGTMPTLTRSLFCGEALTCDDADAWAAAAPNSTVENLYGPTELTISCTVHGRHRDLDEDVAVNGLVPIGELHRGLRHVLVDHQLRPVPDEGELCVTGAQMVRGYLDAADDDGRFLMLDGERWYRTGDRVRRLRTGGLAYLGRLDHQVKVRGYRVELLEVEHELRQLTGVTDCAVFVVRHNDEEVLSAVYRGDPAIGTGAAAALARRLPEYMVPRNIKCVDDLPLNQNGKVDRSALADQALADGAGRP